MSRFWINRIEEIKGGSFMIESTEYETVYGDDGSEVDMVSDFDEPSKSAGRVFFSRSAAAKFASENSIRISDYPDLWRY